MKDGNILYFLIESICVIFNHFSDIFVVKNCFIGWRQNYKYFSNVDVVGINKSYC